jgi:hypothetical protein
MDELEWQLRELDRLVAEEEMLEWEEDEYILEELEDEEELV